jgi:ABC-type transport system substrate-binding protein
MDDPAIRRALQIGFPRGRIAEVSFRGHVRPAAGMIPDGMLDQVWPVNYPAYDLDAARAAIAASSYGSAEKVPPIQIYIAGYEGAQALRDSLQETLGLRIDVIDVEWSEFVAGLAHKSYPAYELYWGADYPDPEALLWVLFGTGRPDNYIGYSNEEFDRLLAAAAVEADQTKRSELIAEAQQILIDDAVVIPLTYDVAYTLQKPHVKGLEVTPLGILRFDSVWLER